MIGPHARTSSRQRGFNLVEMSLVLALAAVVGLHAWPGLRHQLDDWALDAVVADMDMLSRLAFRFKKREARWPVDIGELRKKYAASLSLRERNAFGHPYVLAMTEAGLLELATRAGSVDRAAHLARRLGPLALRIGDRVSMHFDGVDAPEWQPLRADGSLAMRSALNMGGHGLVSASNINGSGDRAYFLLRSGANDGSEVYMNELNANRIYAEEVIRNPNGGQVQWIYSDSHWYRNYPRILYVPPEDAD